MLRSPRGVLVGLHGRCQDRLNLEQSLSMSPETLRSYAYISRAKVGQLYEQLTDVETKQRTVTRRRQAGGEAELGVGGVLGLFKGSIKGTGGYAHVVEDVQAE